MCSIDANLERATPPMRFEYQTSPAVLSFPPLDSFQRSFFRMFGKVVIRKYASTHYARVMRESKAISIEAREIERARFFEEGNNSLGLAFESLDPRSTFRNGINGGSIRRRRCSRSQVERSVVPS